MKIPGNYIKSINDAVEYIETHLQDNITIADIADAVYYSLYHFCRVFNAVIHHTPYDYIIRRRLTKSAQELLDTDKQIIDIALDYQFNNPETFSRAFKKMFGIQPNQLRKQNYIDKRKILSALSIEQIKFRNNNLKLNPKIIEKDKLYISGIMNQINSGDDSNKIWDTLSYEKIKNRRKPEKYYGIFNYPLHQHTSLYYFAGIETDSSETSNSIAVIKTVPKMRWICFSHTIPLNKIDLLMDYIYQTWIPKSDFIIKAPYDMHLIKNISNENKTLKEIYIPIKD